MSKKIVTYPRGFMGIDIGIPIQTKGDSISATLANANYNRQSEELRFVISNNNVETLWKQVKLGLLFTDNLEVREKIITNALLAFGTESFYEWFALQQVNPNLTDMHRRFLNDTLNFISTGKRAMNLLQWPHLIEVRPLTGGDATPALKSDEFFGVRERLENRTDSKLTAIVPRWVSWPGGFEDLLGTMHVLFGDVE